ncbi:SICAvar - type I [Plasmodium knowlesi]|uniref:SICAvar-type I n=2 Tax=Plasmodium knowlesi TaxID=5850 RepID=A0A1Y3DRM4_PLAKN|nr:SICAvar - type I [Plasmodium knowlesi]
MTTPSAGLLQTWLDEQVNGVIQGGATVTEPAEKAKQFSAKLKGDLEAAWEKLSTSLVQSEASDIKTLCHNEVSWVQGDTTKDKFEREYKKDLCAGLMGIRYFLSGITELGGGRVTVEKNITEDQWFARCTVGMLALSDIYGDHCKLNEVIGKISDKVEDNLRKHLKNEDARMIQKCVGKVDATALMIGKSILANKIKGWTEDRRSAQADNGWRLRQLWQGKWKSVCPHDGGQITDDGKKKELKENKDSMTKLMNLDNAQNKNNGMSLSDVLIGDSQQYSLKMETLTKAFQSALENANSGANTASVDLSKTIMDSISQLSQDQLGMCKRLECMQHLWKTDPANAGSSNEQFWRVDDGDVAKLWTDLSTAMMQENGKAATGECEQLGTPSEQTACKFLHAGFTKLYDATATQSPSSSVLNNPSFRQTMGCFLLHAYAKHMKEKATCLIDEGIQKAFKTWEKPGDNGATSCNGANEKCIPCKWEESQFGECQIDINGKGEMKSAKEKVDEVLSKDPTKIEDMAKKINKVDKLCDQVQCVTTRWLKETDGGKNRDWTQVWEKVKEQITELGNGITSKKGDVTNQCNIEDKNGKDACILIAAGLKNLYDINGNNPVHASFLRTMQCVLLNAIADKLQDEKFPCKDEKNVQKGINHAFEKSNSAIKGKSACSSNDKCFECKRVPLTELATCEIGEKDGKKLKEKIEEDLLKEDENTEMKKIKDQAIKDICKPCTRDKGETLCEQLTCIKGKWEKNRLYGVGTANWDNMKGDFGAELKELLTDMRTKQREVATHCNNTTWGTDAHGEANKTACLVTAAGLHHISNIQHTFVRSGPTENKNPYDNQEFRQFASCLMLNAIVREMEEQSPICNIQPGIKKAFDSVKDIIGDCENGRPCIECKLEYYDQLNDCKVRNNANDTMKPKLNSLLKDNSYKSTVDTTLEPITKEEGNNGPSLCPRLQCLASRVQALQTQRQANDFWKKGGEVDKLWKELSEAMTKSNVNATANGCGTMDDGSASGTGATGTGGSRIATNPERKACNYLHAGLKKLYDMTTATSTTPSSTSSGTGSPVLDNPLLKQTVGCLLLNAYAKQMKKEAKCLVVSGIKKAFEKAGTCNGSSSGKEPCVPCQWDEDILTTCQITLNGTEQTPVKEKLTHVQEKINTTSTTTKDNINLTPSLCDQLKCAAPKWFQNNKRVSVTDSTTTNMTWCDFWDKTVKKTLEEMFKKIEENGKNTSKAFPIDTMCRGFGDGNEHSVERKACNHIVAGLKHINTLSGNGNNKQLLDRAVACIALNLYADQIIKKSEGKCPIDEERIQRMFDAWNFFIKNNNSCKSGDNSCFKCERNEKFNGCKLSVSNTLINTPQDGSCNDDDNKDVPKKMNNLLEAESNMQTTLNKINEMDTFCSRLQCAVKQYGKKSLNKTNGQTTSWDTLSTITNMNNSFCTQLQCAAKQYYAKKNGGNSTGVKWDDINDVVEKELKELLGHITNKEKWEEVAQHCNDNIGSSSDATPGEITAKQKACKLFALGLKHISDIKNDKGQDHDVPLRKTMMCAALNLYADQLIKKSTDQCPLDNEKMTEAIEHVFGKSGVIMKNGGTSCNTQGNNSCFVCNREKNFADCQIGTGIAGAKVKEKMEVLLKQNNGETKVQQTLDKINEIKSFCTQVQCAIKQYGKNNKKDSNGTVTWGDIEGDAKSVLAKLLKHITEPSEEKDVADFCKGNPAWNKGHKEKRTNKAACLLFAAGLKHIYGRGRGHTMGQFKGPSFEQTMGCLFLKEYSKQLQTMANKKKKGQSWVHPLCDIDEGINHAFEQSKGIMKSVLPECKQGPNGISCFECKLNEDYKDCSIGSDKVEKKVEPLLQKEQNQMQETLENTVCPILLTDLLTPFLPLAPVSIGLSAMAYYLWKYFGPLGKGGPRFRRSPAEIPGSSVQEQVLDHVQQDSSHEYRLVKERKPRSTPTRTKRSGRVNRRTIIEIHFEVLDECQKGDKQLNQKDFLELLVQEFMGSEFMEEEEQVPKEEVLMEGVPLERVPMESVPMERVPNLGSGFMV